MSQAKAQRETKRQLGQFLTPPAIAKAIVDTLPIQLNDTVLEPSFGTGAFLFALRDKLVRTFSVETIAYWARTQVEGCELDAKAYATFRARWGETERCVQGDFFRFRMPAYNKHRYFAEITPRYDWIIGNPPFGATIAPDIQDNLDDLYGFRHGRKIKKETYAFFIVKSLDLLKPGGRLVFICSDTLLSINTMRGLREYLLDTCLVEVSRLPGMFAETQQPMIVLSLTKGGRGLTVFGNALTREMVEATPNASWLVTPDFARYFTGATLGDFLVATSGMTVGRNELFLRKIRNGQIEELYDFTFSERLVTVALRQSQARLGKLSTAQIRHIRELEQAGATEPCVTVSKRAIPSLVPFPHPDYAPYNKATSAILYAPPDYAIYWKDDGRAVYTFKKSGPWYLHGVGGKPYFKREGLTWQLISSRLNIRYLPPGYILDSGAPCAFLRSGVNHDELFFIMGWCLTDICNIILKKVINHTRNIQSKDFERLPYPSWVSPTNKAAVVALVKNLLARAKQGERIQRGSPALAPIENLFAYVPGTHATLSAAHQSSKEPRQLMLAFE